MVATTLRNLFQTERLQKIKMSPTTPVSVTEDLLYENVLDGVPDGEPGLTKNFFERVPFLPDSISPTEESTDKMSSLQETLNSLNRKLEQLKQGSAAEEEP